MTEFWFAIGDGFCSGVWPAITAWMAGLAVGEDAGATGETAADGDTGDAVGTGADGAGVVTAADRGVAVCAGCC
nr:hypothetical protein [uncultured Rhodopila sp.]